MRRGVGREMKKLAVRRSRSDCFTKSAMRCFTECTNRLARTVGLHLEMVSGPQVQGQSHSQQSPATTQLLQLRPWRYPSILHDRTRIFYTPSLYRLADHVSRMQSFGAPQDHFSPQSFKTGELPSGQEALTRSATRATEAEHAGTRFPGQDSLWASYLTKRWVQRSSGLTQCPQLHRQALHLDTVQRRSPSG